MKSLQTLRGHLLQKEVPKTAEKNILKPDIILKNFWKDNNHFADLFNAVLFGGKQVLKPDDLTECDTDLSSMLKFNGHSETLQKVLDVVKKTAYGIDFVIWGLENQNKVHYAMPLRHMLGDSFSYLKEYNEIAARNKMEKNFVSSSEFLSNFKKTDRLHPVISLCVYYGEEEWDGPFCLKDMLEIPEELEPLVSDYKMNLLQLRSSEEFSFHNSDVKTVFDISRSIYNKNFTKIIAEYKNRTISSELGVVIGAITGYQNLINQTWSEEGGQMHMCKALQELEDHARQEGMLIGIQSVIGLCKKFSMGKEEAVKTIVKDFSLQEVEAAGYVEKYW